MEKIKENLFCISIFFFTGTNYHFVDANREKPTLCWHFLNEAKKSKLQGLDKNLNLEGVTSICNNCQYDWQYCRQ